MALLKVPRSEGSESQPFATRQQPEEAEARSPSRETNARNHASFKRAATFSPVLLLVAGSLEHNR